ncbi:MAG: bifunctional riboflavin kinase/FAD synthetase [Thermoleophilia bacterium]
MKTYQSMGGLPLGFSRRVVAIGTFDGVHIGHQAVIGAAVREAAGRGLSSMAITFEPHPISVLRPELRPTLITPLARKAELIESLGVDELLVLPFTRAFARIRADRFVDMIASAPVAAEVVVVGANFRFGHGGEGTADGLRAHGRSRGVEVLAPPLVASPDGKPISSTRIRRLIAEGRIDEVSPLLGRPHRLSGEVVPGDQRGRALGLPTANLEPPPELAVPGRGVYAARALVGDRAIAAAVNVGFAPTFRDDGERAPLRVEAFLIDYAGPDLYGRTIGLDFLSRLRDERRFATPQALVEQIHEDVARTRAVAGVRPA